MDGRVDLQTSFAQLWRACGTYGGYYVHADAELDLLLQYAIEGDRDGFPCDALRGARRCAIATAEDAMALIGAIDGHTSVYVYDPYGIGGHDGDGIGARAAPDQWARGEGLATDDADHSGSGRWIGDSRQ